MNFVPLTLVLLFISSFNVVLAQEEEDSSRQQTNAQRRYMPDLTPEQLSTLLLANISSPFSGVKTEAKVIYPKNETSIYIEEFTPFLIGFENTASNKLVITDVCASFADPGNPQKLISNFSVSYYNITVKPHEVHTFEYDLYLKQKTTASTYIVTLYVFYHDEFGNHYTSLPLNETIRISERIHGLDTRTFLILLSLLSLLIVFAVYKRKELLLFFKTFSNRLQSGSFLSLFSQKKEKKKEKENKYAYNTGNKKMDEKLNKRMEEEDEELGGTSTMKYIIEEREKKLKRRLKKEAERNKSSSLSKNSPSPSPERDNKKEKRGRSKSK